MLDVAEPRTVNGRAPDVFRPGKWVDMRTYDDSEEVDFAIVGTGAGGGTLACKLAEAGFSVIAFDAGPFWRPLEDFVSDENWQGGLYWTDERITGGADPVELGANNSGRGVGGSTVHYTMIALRWRPEWFKCTSTLGYGRDWPISFDELEPYYEEAEEALKISGPIRYPWGKRRKRYPYREHEVNAAGLVLARGCEAIGIKWSPLPLATLSAPRGMAHPCVYRGFCAYGCSTNAKQSVLVTFIPRALKAGAEVRDLAMVGRIEMGKDGKATGLTYHRAGQWRHQKAKHVVVAGYAIETPRLLLNSKCNQFPDGLANETGLVGTHIMIHSGPGVWGIMDEEVRCYKAPPCMAVTEHWNYDDSDKKDFHGAYAFMSSGPATGRLGAGNGDQPRHVGHEPPSGDDPLQSYRRPSDRRRDRAAAAQSGRGRGREGPVRPSDSPDDLHLFGERSTFDEAFHRIDEIGAWGRGCKGAVGRRRHLAPHGRMSDGRPPR